MEELRTVILCPHFVDKSRKDEAHYHPRLIYVEPEIDEASEAETYDQQSHSDGSYSPRRSRLSSGGSSEESSPRRRPGPKKLSSVSPNSPRKPEHSERMFDDSDDDDSTEKEDTNLNWTLPEVTTAVPSVPSGTGRRQGGSSGSKIQGSGSGLINLCAAVPPVPGSGGSIPSDVRSAASINSHTTQEGKCVCRNMCVCVCI